MKNSLKQVLQSPQEPIWITYKDDDGTVKSAPLEIFQEIAKKRGWKQKPTDWDI